MSLASKTRSFLEESSWKNEPWVGIGLPPKSPQNELIDIMVELPGHLQDVSEIEKGTASATRRPVLLQRLRSNLEDLYDWRCRWQRTNSSSVWEIEPTQLPLGRFASIHRPFHKMLWFRRHTQATEIQLYNAALLCTLGLLWQFEHRDKTGSVLPPDYPLRMPNQYVSLQEPAEEICRIFEYQTLNATSYRESALFWLLPIGVAHKVLGTNPRYEFWIQSMLDASQTTRGYGSRTKEFAFGNYDFLEPVLRAQKA